MPNGFQEQLAKWEAQAKGYWDRVQTSQQKLVDYGKRLEFVSAPLKAITEKGYVEITTPEQLATYPGYKELFQKYPWLQKPTFYAEEAAMSAGHWTAIPTIMRAPLKAEVNRIRGEIDITLNEMQKDKFFATLYSEVPTLIYQSKLVRAGKAKPIPISTYTPEVPEKYYTAISSPDDILNNPDFMPPSLLASLNPDELSQIKDTLTQMISIISGEPVVPKMAGEAPLPELPELVAPTEVTAIPVSMNQLTIEEILKSLSTVPPPPPVMSQQEYIDYLKAQGYTDEDLTDADLLLQQQAKEIIDDIIESNNQLAAYREGLAQMPDYKLADIFKEVLISPGLAMMDFANVYYKHVSQPLAGLAWRNVIPDLEAAYQEYDKTESKWYAAGHAWREWDSPGSGAASWGLKYMIMENLTDPLSYVGYGLYTKITKPIPPLSRLVGAAESGYNMVANLPFDLFKTKILKRIPKLPSQIALEDSMADVKVVRKFITGQLGPPINNPEYMHKVSVWMQRAVNIARRHPEATSDIVDAGKALLKHGAVDEETIYRWAGRMGSDLTTNQITKEMADSVTQVVDDYFWRGIKTPIRTLDEMATKLAQIIAPNNMDNARIIAKRILVETEEAIVRDAISTGSQKTFANVIRTLGKRNFQLEMSIMNSSAYLARKQAGAFTSLLHGTSVKLQAIWRNQIDRFIVRPFAQAYLAFGMYGPMNVWEDYGRTALGGVKPGRVKEQLFNAFSAGTSFDPMLVSREGVSELLGPISSRSADNNWILNLFGQAKGWGNKIYEKLVEIPGARGAAIRRNFVLQKTIQEMAENGGDAFTALARVEAAFPKIADKKLIDSIRQYVNIAKLSGNKNSVLSAIDVFSKKNIVKGEVYEIVLEHPELPLDVRKLFLDKMDEGELFLRGADSITDATTDARRLLDDVFLRSPERAIDDYHRLSEFVTGFEVTNKVELSQSLNAITYASDMYGALPREIAARASISSRGMKFADRSAAIQAANDRIFMFMDKAGSDLDNMIRHLETQIVKPGLGLTDDYTRVIKDLFNVRTLRRDVADKFRADYITWSEGYFKGAKPADLKSGGFWDEFYGVKDSKFYQLDTDMMRLDKLEHQAMDRANNLMGVGLPSKPPVIVRDRPLSFLDVSNLLGVRSNDITTALLDMQALLHNKERFTEYVKMFVRDGVDIGFTDDAIGAVYEQVMKGLGVDPKAASWMLKNEMELDAIRRDLISLHNSKMLPEAEMDEITRYVTQTADMAEDLMYEPVYYRGIGKGEGRQLGLTGQYFTRTREEAEYYGPKVLESYLNPRNPLKGDNLEDIVIKLDMRDEIERIAGTKLEMGIAYEEDVEELIFAKARRLGYDAIDIGEWVAVLDDSIIQIAKGVAPTTTGYRGGELKEVIGRTATEGEGLYVSKSKEFAGGFGKVSKVEFTQPNNPLRLGVGDELPSIGGTVKKTTGTPWLDEPIKSADSPWIRLNKQAAKDVGYDVGDPTKFNRRLNELLRGEGYDAVIVPKSIAGDEFYVLLDESLWKVPSMGVKLALKPAYQGWQQLRQSSTDEAHKWYYNYFTDYTHANAFDAMMKTIYPYWTYESQRLLFVPRAFLTHPGTFMAFERWQDNTEYGYVHIPGTSLDINPFRGTAWGMWTTRLVRRDFPEYYDSLGIAGGYVGFMDFLSRYGFYPGAHFALPLAYFGGTEQQMGETLPAIWKTPLSALQAVFPKSESVKWITDHIFPDRFRDYLTMVEVTKLGGEAKLIYAKMKEGVKLTDEEQSLWDAARGSVGIYSMLMEQTSLFRLRTDEQYRLAEEATKVIEEMSGITADQQEWYQRHGYNLWEIFGGMPDDIQKALQELGYYKYVGLSRPLLPGHQQEELNKLELDWNDIRTYSENQLSQMLEIQQDFLTGSERGRLSPRDFDERLFELWNNRQEFINQRQKDNPNLTLEGRKEFALKYNTNPPMLSPFEELRNLYYQIKLEETVDPITGERIYDWDKFFLQRDLIDTAIPDYMKGEWEKFKLGDTTRIVEVRRYVLKYFRKYNELYDAILERFTPEEQQLIEEYLGLERTGQGLDRQKEIEAMVTSDGRQLISAFRTDVSNSRRALRYANPTLDAWLYYWGRVTSFATPEAETIYRQICSETGRAI